MNGNIVAGGKLPSNLWSVRQGRHGGHGAGQARYPRNARHRHQRVVGAGGRDQGRVGLAHALFHVSLQNVSSLELSTT